MKNILLLCLTFFSSLLVAQQAQDITVYEKKEGTKNIVIARNTGKIAYVVTIKLRSSGMDVTPSMQVEAVIPAGHIKEMATLTPRPGESWSYGYDVSFTEHFGDTPKSADPVTSTPPSNAATAHDSDHASPTATTLSDARIIVYTKPGCGRCAAVKKQMDDKKLEYELVDVSSTSPEVNNMWQKLRESGFNGGSVTMPVVRVDGKYYYDIKDLGGFVGKL